MILKLLGVGSRLIVTVDEVNADVRFESQPTPRMVMSRLLHKVDPSFRRTVFVYTKIDILIQKCRANKIPLNRYFRNEFGKKNCFWITTLSNETRQKVKHNSDAFRKVLIDQQKQDLEELFNFEFDKKYGFFLKEKKEKLKSNFFKH